MSGGGLRGAKPAVDIKTKKANRDAVTGRVKKESDVAIKMKIDKGLPVKIGMRVEQAQAAGVVLKITKPVMPVTKEATTLPPVAATQPVSFELAAAFPLPAGSTEQWVAWTGTIPGAGQVNKLDLETELEIDGSAIPANGYQMVPVVMTYVTKAFATDHYLVDSSIIPGETMRAIAAPIGATAKKSGGTKTSSKKSSKKKR